MQVTCKWCGLVVRRRNDMRPNKGVWRFNFCCMEHRKAYTASLREPEGVRPGEVKEALLAAGDEVLKAAQGRQSREVPTRAVMAHCIGCGHEWITAVEQRQQGGVRALVCPACRKELGAYGGTIGYGR